MITGIQHKCIDCNKITGNNKNHSQLQRIFIVTPPAPCGIVCNPIIKSLNKDEIFKLECHLILPSSNFIVLRLPYMEKKNL